MISDFASLPAAVGTLTAATETVLITNVLDAGAGTGAAPQGRVIRGYLAFTTGAATGTMTIRVRQGSLTGPLVGQAATTVVITTAATTQYVVPFCLQDTSNVAVVQYVVTATITGANASVQDGNCEVFFPDPFGAA